LPEKISTAPEKTATLPAKLLCPTHPTQYLLVKFPDFGIQIFLFNKYKKEHFFRFWQLSLEK